jgi:hypothetical protein
MSNTTAVLIAGDREGGQGPVVGGDLLLGHQPPGV